MATRAAPTLIGMSVVLMAVRISSRSSGLFAIAGLAVGDVDGLTVRRDRARDRAEPDRDRLERGARSHDQRPLHSFLTPFPDLAAPTAWTRSTQALAMRRPT